MRAHGDHSPSQIIRVFRSWNGYTRITTVPIESRSKVRSLVHDIGCYSLRREPVRHPTPIVRANRNIEKPVGSASNDSIRNFVRAAYAGSEISPMQRSLKRGPWRCVLHDSGNTKSWIDLGGIEVSPIAILFFPWIGLAPIQTENKCEPLIDLERIRRKQTELFAAAVKMDGGLFLCLLHVAQQETGKSKSDLASPWHRRSSGLAIGEIEKQWSTRIIRVHLKAAHFPTKGEGVPASCPREAVVAYEDVRNVLSVGAVVNSCYSDAP